MTENDFLQIFKTSFHKLTLQKVKLVQTCKNPQGRVYYKFHGLFTFIPPYQIWQDGEKINKSYLKQVLNKISKNSSNCINRKFTKKIIKNDKTVEKIVFKYVFDVIPENIIDFDFNKSKKSMNLIVKGYGLFQ